MLYLHQILPDNKNLDDVSNTLYIAVMDTALYNSLNFNLDHLDNHLIIATPPGIRLESAQ